MATFPSCEIRLWLSLGIVAVILLLVQEAAAHIVGFADGAVDFLLTGIAPLGSRASVM